VGIHQIVKGSSITAVAEPLPIAVQATAFRTIEQWCYEEYEAINERILGDGEVIAAMARTNAVGWCLEDLEVLAAAIMVSCEGDSPQEAVYSKALRIRIRFRVAGEQVDPEKMDWGNTVTGEFDLVIPQDGCSYIGNFEVEDPYRDSEEAERRYEAGKAARWVQRPHIASGDDDLDEPSKHTDEPLVDQKQRAIEQLQKERDAANQAVEAADAMVKAAYDDAQEENQVLRKRAEILAEACERIVARGVDYHGSEFCERTAREALEEAGRLQ
jgi:hypothetical protein